jgi:hypothetical protein
VWDAPWVSLSTLKQALASTDGEGADPSGDGGEAVDPTGGGGEERC